MSQSEYNITCEWKITNAYEWLTNKSENSSLQWFLLLFLYPFIISDFNSRIIEYERARLNMHASKRISIFTQIFHTSSLIPIFFQLLWIYCALYCTFMRIHTLIYFHGTFRLNYRRMADCNIQFSSLWLQIIWRKQME